MMGGPKQMIRHFLKFAWLPLLLVLAGTGCKDEVKVGAGNKTAVATNPNLNPTGTYALVTVDGNKVPCTVQHEGHTMTISGGSFSIEADGACASKMFLASRDAAIEVKATYTREGSKLTMKWQGAGTTLGTVEGDTFVMNNEGMVFAYRK